ncbi:HDOD domain-containing protein [Chitinilyticum piscinae]|uniref:HDOD domain-containing protein n=1 Tax=Chitinilyticum piscinae TaxID=2866724 RepID=A0A8J7FYA9_9NEIS|nr:HDOD domain-containing protein [Chitinilyticum piscinae]MBE9607943.1 HDOD domain-containing protein [Chitinilyticum piscinae]
MALIHLHPLWDPAGQWQALFALCPREQQPWLAEQLADTPALHELPCYVPGALPDLPQLQNLQLQGKLWLGEGVRITGGYSTATFLQTLPAGSLCYGNGYLHAQHTLQGHPSQPALMHILSLVVDDADTRQLEEAFAHAPSLTVSLLKLVNSVGIGSRVEVTSIRHAITVLGRRQLQRWLQLLLYAEQFADSEGNRALMTGAALRAKRLEQWAERSWLNHPADSAFLIGMLSLLDRLFGVPLQELLAGLPLPPALRDALLAHEGELGRALLAAEALETASSTELPASSITPRAWLESEVAALGWARQLQTQGHTQRA